MVMPKWARNFLHEDDLRQIEAAVLAAERTTSGEIIPMVVQRSSVTGHVVWVLALFLLITSHLTISAFPRSVDVPFWVLALFDVVIILFSFFMARFSWIQRLCTPRSDIEFQVAERAELEFHRQHIAKTKERTGILIFLSLMEREVVVLGDKLIADKLPSETWQSVVETILVGLKDGKAGEGISRGIIACGKILAEHFPRKADDTDELENHLVILE